MTEAALGRAAERLCVQGPCSPASRRRTGERASVWMSVFAAVCCPADIRTYTRSTPFACTSSCTFLCQSDLVFLMSYVLQCCRFVISKLLFVLSRDVGWARWQVLHSACNSGALPDAHTAVRVWMVVRCRNEAARNAFLSSEGDFMIQMTALHITSF